MSTFEQIIYIGLAGFIGVNLNSWLTKLLLRFNLKISSRYHIPWGIIIINAIAALILGIFIEKLEDDTFLFQYICVGLIGSIGSSYILFSNYLIRKNYSKNQKIVQVVRLIGEILIDTLCLILGLQIGSQ
ncbi:hypothetical protein [Candidatus Lokiarchaeum ossiferum]|uniref:hypothetical protein n=1 Tax=Candidatus Lokiarchaeum ossiferum TaxID=2951803 RepID=UPI00352FA663